ncbi:hypothetical protein OHT59_05310 [Streptomyces sp. NBC_00243]|nr:hypothetical protein [Streptomyces sp. NBC_00243]WRZ17947.1 hypothetical protein OHT59_05310 [Streptomyces sp. NBC_00243]
MASGWAPRRLRSRLTPVRPRGWAFLALYAAAPLNALPRLTHAASEVVLASTVAAGVIAAAGCVAAAAITMRSAADTAR